MRTIVLLCLAAAAAVTPAGCAPQQPTELDRYVAQIRTWGMGEAAHQSLATAASIIDGGTRLEYLRDSTSGYWGTRYMSTSCPLPGADSAAVAAWQKEQADSVEVLVRLLRESADADRSGFVTSAEGRDLRGLVEFGYLADHMFRHGPFQRDELEKSTRTPPGGLVGRAESYNAVATRFNEATSGRRLPVLELDRLAAAR
jgi:hypothetical protein